MSLPESICREIALTEDCCTYKLHEWINAEKLEVSSLAYNPRITTILKEILANTDAEAIRLGWVKVEFAESRYFSANPASIPFLKKYPNKIDWYMLSENRNPEAIPILQERLELVSWSGLSENPNAVEILKANPDKIMWHRLALNPNPEAIKILRENPDKIFPENLVRNHTDEAIKLLKEVLKPEEIGKMSHIFSNPCSEAVDIVMKIARTEPHKINWKFLCVNSHPVAVEFLKKNLNSIQWTVFSTNINPEAIKMLREKANTEPNILDWCMLTQNSEAIEILLEHQDKIWEGIIAVNPAIFEKVVNQELFEVLLSL